MCRKSPGRVYAVSAVIFVFAAPLGVAATADWRHLGNSVMDLGLASPATGPVERVWYSIDGATLYARTHSGKTYATVDFEQWRMLAGFAAPREQTAAAVNPPVSGSKVFTVPGSTRLYGLGKAAYRSDDGGRTWSNLSQYRGMSLLGGGLMDLAVSPRDPAEVVVAASSGVWRSLDAGLSWTGLNQSLPNLPVKKIFSLPNGMRGLRIALDLAGAPELEWNPGERSAWHPVEDPEAAREEAGKAALSNVLGAKVTAVGTSGGFVYAGSADGQLWVSADRGATWGTPSDRLGAPVEAIFASPRDSRVALAAVGARNPKSSSQARPAHVLRTMNGGIFWDDVTSNLPDAAAHGVTADPASGAIYVATGAGVFMTAVDLESAGRPTSWEPLTGEIPQAPAMDVKLDAGGNQLFAALDGPGIYTTIAPHRIRDVKVVNAADFSGRAAAPGGLLSVIGARVQSAQTADSPVPVLAANGLTSQIQVPFDVKGSALALSLQAESGRWNLGLPLQSASPAIFVDPDGSPMVLDGETGVLLDGSRAARANSRIQVLATGLGRVTPDWPAGLAAPLSNPPHVQAPVHVYLNRVPLKVTQAVLAPGYIGFYLVEAEIPAIVNDGEAELYVEIEGQTSNRVRLLLSQ